MDSPLFDSHLQVAFVERDQEVQPLVAKASRTPVALDHSAKLIRGLLDPGLIDKVMFSIDSLFYLHQGGIGLCAYDMPERTSNFVFTFVLPQLRKLGISDGEIRRMMVDNPRRHLCGA